MKNHTEGAGPGHAKYMRSHKPVEIMALWQTEEYKVAAKLEYAIKKKLTRQGKLGLISTPEKVYEFFPHLAGYEFVPVNNVSLSQLIE